MQIQDTVAAETSSGNLHSSGDTWHQNLNRIVQTSFCIIEIAEVISSLAELEKQSMSF